MNIFSRLKDAIHKLTAPPVEEKASRGRPPGRSEFSRCREEQFIALYKDGKTLEEIGAQFGITRERVRQVLKIARITKLDGGAAMRSFMNTHDKVAAIKSYQDAMSARHFAKYGCSKEFIDSISPLLRTNTKHPVFKFRYQRNSANGRKQPWNLTFKEWWDIWAASGKWNERGRGGDLYCMARIGNLGAFEVGNVEIVSFKQNGRDYQRFFPSGAKRGQRRGVYCQYPGTSKPYVAKLGKKVIGHYSTEAEARNARDSYDASLQ